MKTSKLTFYFFIITLFLLLMLTSFFYIFSKEKENALNSTIQNYHNNSTKLITEKVYEDLLIDNLLEARRKLDLLKSNKVINDYQIIKKDLVPEKLLKYCETIFFDKNNKSKEWGKLCIDFSQSNEKNSLIDLKRISFVFILLIAFIIFLVFFSFKKISEINNELYTGIRNILNYDSKTNFTNSFWSPVLTEIEKLVVLNKENEQKLLENKIENEKIEMANQVSHDIRSPLTTLNNIDLNKLPNTNDGKLAKDAVKRLNGIANLLLAKTRGENDEELCEINPFNSIINILDAKEVEFKKRIIEKRIQNHYCFIKVNDVKFESILSNLITNAFEASNETLPITIESEIRENNIYITIADHGNGIPSDILSKIGKEKITYNKNQGNGFGLFYAFQTIKAWGGEIDIKSHINIGTSITIALPISSKSNKKTQYVLLDNDELVCLTWKSRAKKNDIHLKIFSSSSELFSEISSFTSDTLFYIDSELDNEHGEDVAKELYNKGFINLFICSGHPAHKFNHLFFIKKVITKSPPF